MADERLHIGIDARELLGQPTGVGRYVTQVLREWRAGPPLPHRVTLFSPAEPSLELRTTHRGIEWVVASGAAASGTVWEQLALPRALDRAEVDVFFAAGYTAPVTMPCPFVVAIYAVSYFAHPEWFAWREGLRRRWLTRRAAHRASSVITISEFSASEIARWCGVSRNRIRLAPPGAPPVVVLQPDRPREPLVLFVGSLFTRRHIPELLAGFAETLRRVPNARLLLVGDNRTNPRISPMDIAGALGIRDRVEWRAYAGDAELAGLYSRASVFAFLSDYEGFAMTPMEAIAAGAPAILLDTAVAREVYGDGARLVPLSTPAIADGLVTLLSDEDERAALLARGRARMTAFSWARTSRIVLEALEQSAE